MYKSRASLIPCLWVYALNGRTPSTPVFQMPRLRAGRADQPFMEGAVGACGSSSDSWTYQPRKTKMENENEWRYIYMKIMLLFQKATTIFQFWFRRLLEFSKLSDSSIDGLQRFHDMELRSHNNNNNNNKKNSHSNSNNGKKNVHTAYIYINIDIYVYTYIH